MMTTEEAWKVVDREVKKAFRERFEEIFEVGKPKPFEEVIGESDLKPFTEETIEEWKKKYPVFQQGGIIYPRGHNVKMQFDIKKVLTTVSGFDVKEGDYGWASNSLKKLKTLVELNTPVKITRINGMGENSYPFSVQGSTGLKYFYPAPYNYMQAQWVKRNLLRVGDAIKIKEDWESSAWFTPAMDSWSKTDPLKVGDIGFVTDIELNSIIVQFHGKYKWSVPYFAIKIVSKHRPFSGLSEFVPFRDCWFRKRIPDGVLIRYSQVTDYNDRGVWIGGEAINWQRFFDEWIFDASGKPAGVNQ